MYKLIITKNCSNCDKAKKFINANNLNIIFEDIKDEDVEDFKIEEYTNFINYLKIIFKLKEKQVRMDIALDEMGGNFQSRTIPISELVQQFDEEFDRLKEYLESKNSGELKELNNKLIEYEKEIRNIKDKIDKINNYGEL